MCAVFQSGCCLCGVAQPREALQAIASYVAGIAILPTLLAGVLTLAARSAERAPVAAGTGAFRRWLAGNYVLLIFLAAIAVLLVALAIGLWRVPLEVDGLISQLTAARGDPEATRAIVTAIAAALAAVGILGAMVVGTIRVWTSERQTTANERQTKSI